jgi:phosphatidylserine decarboxylase
MARRVKLYARPGQEVEQGAEIGFITFGSRIDLLIPLGCPVLVNLGDKVKAGQTPLAELEPLRPV